MYILVRLKFTPLEFETEDDTTTPPIDDLLKFTPLEFETKVAQACPRPLSC